jgi:hypothetical protein
MMGVAQEERSTPTVIASLVAGAVAGVLAVTFMFSYASVIMASADPALTPRHTSQFREVVALPRSKGS